MPIDFVKGPMEVLPGAAAAKDPGLQEMRLKKAVADFEAIFIQYLLKCMRETVPRSDLFGGGSSQDICRSLLDEELSRTLAGGRGIGLAKVVLQKMLHPGQPVSSGKETGDQEFEGRPIQGEGET